MNQQIILQGLTVSQFLEQIDQRILSHLENFPGPVQAESEEILDVNQVAELLHTTPQNIHAKKRAGQIPFSRFGGRVLFKKSEVLASLPSIRIQKSI